MHLSSFTWNKLPPCLDLRPHPHQILMCPPSLPMAGGGGGGRAQPPLMFATPPVGNPVKRSIFLLWLYIFEGFGIKSAVSHRGVFWYCLHSMGAQLIF